jgi:ribonuclease J
MLKVIPLGGLGEVGMNTMVLEHAGERLLIDCGLMFPRGDQLGVDVVLPDFTWLKESGDSLKGIVLTHAHEDHIGALPWLLREVNVPVYGTPFTLALARHRLVEAGINADLREMEPRNAFSVGDSFRVEPIRVTHSVPDAVGLSIKTPSASAIHTGDFKLDGMPIDGRMTDLERLGELGDEGVSVLLSDSTNSEVAGWTGSEQLVKETFERIFSETKGRLIIAMFGSHLHRVRHAIELARQFGRRVVLLGRSLQRNVELAQAVGIFEPYKDVLVPFDAAPHIPGSQLLMLCTGAQAEPRSALQTMLNPEPGPLRLEQTDTVILSSRTIPGNEPAVSGLINRLLARRVKVITSSLEPGIHVSGHASQDEQKKVLQVVRPKHFVPIHGELRHLHRHLLLAKEVGLRDDQLFLTTDGDVLGLDADGARTLGRVPTGQQLMRREGVAPVSEVALQERRWLAETGLVVAVVVLQMGSGKILTGPVLQAQALQGDEVAALPLATEGARKNLTELSEAMRGDDARVREELIRGVRRVFKQLLGTRPTVVPIVVRLP